MQKCQSICLINLTVGAIRAAGDEPSPVWSSAFRRSLPTNGLRWHDRPTISPSAVRCDIFVEKRLKNLSSARSGVTGHFKTSQSGSNQNQPLRGGLFIPVFLIRARAFSISSFLLVRPAVPKPKRRHRFLCGKLDSQYIFRKRTDAAERIWPHASRKVESGQGLTSDIGALD